MSQKINKIAIVGPAYPLRGGIANFNEALSLALTEYGIENKVFSFHYQYPNILFPGKTQYATDGSAPDHVLIEDSISSINPFTWKNTAGKIRAYKPDAVIIRYWLPFMAPALGGIAKRLRKKGIKVIAITDNVIPHEKRIGDKSLTSYFIKQIDGFITLSKSVLTDIESFTDNPNKIMLPHPVYDIFGKPSEREKSRKFLKLKNSDKVLLFFGLIRPYKGLDLALQALKESKYKDVQFIVAGEFYEPKEKYETIVKELGLENQVQFHDRYIPDEEVSLYFGAANAVLQTYKTATQSGITQIAYHFNIPMIVTKVGGLPEIVPHNVVGLVAEPNPSEIAKAIDQYFEDAAMEQQFRSNIPSEKEKYQWSYFVEKSMKFISEI